MADPKNTVMVTLAAALVVPRIERVTGVKLTTDDVAALLGLAVVAWHGLSAWIDSRFPPKPVPVSPAETK